MPLILFFLCISSGSVYAAARWERKYEEVLPLTCCTMVLTMFLFGVFGFLKLGAAVVCAACAGLYVLTALRVGKQKTGRVLLQNVFTSGFALFLAFNLMYILCICGKLFDKTDEFTHWGDTVRILCNLDAFGTHPDANSNFASYPPAMSIFQYFLQKLNHWKPGMMVEWLCYYAYQVFALSFLMPLWGKGRRSLLGFGAFAMGLFCLPHLFFPHYYDSILIDAFLGIVSGAGICLLVWEKNRDFLYHARILATCAVLVLAKDAGALFAVILAAMYALEQRQSEKKLHPAALAAAAVAGPKLLWSLHVWFNHAQVAFSQKIVLSQLVNIVLGRDNSYRQQVWHLFLEALTTPRTEIISLRTYFQLHLPPLAVMVLLVVLVWGILRFCAGKGDVAPGKVPIVTGLLALQMAAYTVGMGLMYLFKFSQSEALELASFERYYSILFQSAWTVVLMGLVMMLKYWKPLGAAAAAAVLAGFLAVASPVTLMKQYLSHDAVRQSQDFRNRFVPLSGLLAENAKAEDRILMVCMECSDSYPFVLRYATQLNHFEGFCAAPYGPEVDPEEWAGQLWENYDYVALFRFDGDFSKEFGAFFEEDGQIQFDTLYRVDAGQKKLIRCE